MASRTTRSNGQTRAAMVQWLVSHGVKGQDLADIIKTNTTHDEIAKGLIGWMKNLPKRVK